jgi:hypothetical protein
MHGGEWSLAVVNCLLASLLIVAGVAKVVSPAQLRVALRDTFPRLAVTHAQLRVFAILEIGSGLTLAVPGVRVAGACVVGALAACFMVLGALGWLRHSHTACGCFGGSSDRPLGPLNVLLGVILFASAFINVYARGEARSGTYFSFSATGTALAAVLLCALVNRRIIRDLTHRLATSR